MLDAITSTASAVDTHVSTQAHTTAGGRVRIGRGRDPQAAPRTGRRTRPAGCRNRGKARGVGSGLGGAAGPPDSRTRRVRDGSFGVARDSRTTPLNQSLEGWNHSITEAAATTDDRKPPVTIPLTNSGTASTVSASRALRLRWSTW